MRVLIKLFFGLMLMVSPTTLNGDIKKSVSRQLVTNTAKKSAITTSKDLVKQAAKGSGKLAFRKSIKHIGLSTNEKLARRFAIRQTRLALSEQMKAKGITSLRGCYRTITATTVQSVKKKVASDKFINNRSAINFFKGLTGETQIPKIKSIDIKRGYIRNSLMRKRIVSSKIYQDVTKIQTKGGITLSSKELNQLKRHPQYIREFIKVKADGNRLGFLIRLSQGNPDQVKSLLSVEYIRKYYNSVIRRSSGGGNHEWLMVKNLEDFLTNPKWGDDGPFLTATLAELVQKTDKISFITGGGHGKISSTTFHNELSKIISACNTKEELFINIRRFARANLTSESYQDFETQFLRSLM